VTEGGVSLGPVVGGGVVGATDDVGVGVREGATRVLVADRVTDGGTRLAVGVGVGGGVRVGVMTTTGGTKIDLPT